MPTDKSGFFCFVLHSHLPYVRKAGRWPHGEEMLHEALAETYIPLLNALYDLKTEGVKPNMTLGLTPILIEQIADKDVNEHFELYLHEKLEGAQDDVDRFAREEQSHLLYLARFYADWYANILTSYVDRYDRNVVQAFGQLLSGGDVDIITSAATHCYLPLAERDSTIYGQLKTGVDSYFRHFRTLPHGIWLPECGYRPGYYKTNGQTFYKPGIEEFLEDLGLEYFFTDTHVIQGGALVGKVAGDAAGAYGAMPKRKLAAARERRPRATHKTTFRPYFVEASDVAVYGRDASTGLQVWSASHGYPGDFVYREFHRKDENHGFQYWKITGAGVGLGEKDLYDPVVAQGRAAEHARHFVGLVESLHREYRAANEVPGNEVPGIVVSAYDTELFGHWWFEGIDWLKEVMRLLDRGDVVGLATAHDYLVAYPPDEALSLPESSWGLGGGHWTWRNPETDWMWPMIQGAERRMERIVQLYPQASAVMLDLLKQTSRELVLLESSDWPFLITTGQAKEYATGRFQQHVDRFNHLASIVEVGDPTEEDLRFLNTAAELDNPFPNVDYHVFKEREQRADASEPQASKEK